MQTTEWNYTHSHLIDSTSVTRSVYMTMTSRQTTKYATENDDDDDDSEDPARDCAMTFALLSASYDLRLPVFDKTRLKARRPVTSDLRRSTHAWRSTQVCCISVYHCRFARIRSFGRRRKKRYRILSMRSYFYAPSILIDVNKNVKPPLVVVLLV